MYPSHNSLHAAIEADDITSIKRLIENGASLLEKDTGGYEPLVAAIAYKQLEAAKTIIATKKALKKALTAEERDAYGKALAVAATEQVPLELIQDLLAAGADPNRFSWGNEQQGYRYALCSAVQQGNAELVKLLVSYGADVTVKHRIASNEAKGKTAIELAVDKADWPVVAALVTAKGRTATAQECATYTYVLGKMVIKQAPIATIKALLKAGAHPDGPPGLLYWGTADMGYASALYWAVAQENIELITLLINYGADINQGLKKNNGFTDTPIIRAMRKQKWNIVTHLLAAKQGIATPAERDCYSSALPAAVAYDAPPEVIQALLKAGANPNKFKWGNDKDGYGYALHMAAKKGDIELLKLLLRKGADLDQRTTKNLTALEEAIFRRQWQAVECIVAAKSAQPSAKETACYTQALPCAIYQNAPIAVIKMLLAAGADIQAECNVNDSNIREVYGCALHWAACNDEQGLAVDLLIDQGAILDSVSVRQKATPLQLAIKNQNWGNVFILALAYQQQGYSTEKLTKALDEVPRSLQTILQGLQQLDIQLGQNRIVLALQILLDYLAEAEDAENPAAYCAEIGLALQQLNEAFTELLESTLQAPAAEQASRIYQQNCQELGQFLLRLDPHWQKILFAQPSQRYLLAVQMFTLAGQVTLDNQQLKFQSYAGLLEQAGSLQRYERLSDIITSAGTERVEASGIVPALTALAVTNDTAAQDLISISQALNNTTDTLFYAAAASAKAETRAQFYQYLQALTTEAPGVYQQFVAEISSYQANGSLMLTAVPEIVCPPQGDTYLTVQLKVDDQPKTIKITPKEEALVDELAQAASAIEKSEIASTDCLATNLDLSYSIIQGCNENFNKHNEAQQELFQQKQTAEQETLRKSTRALLKRLKNMTFDEGLSYEDKAKLRQDANQQLQAQLDKATDIVGQVRILSQAKEFTIFKSHRSVYAWYDPRQLHNVLCNTKTYNDLAAQEANLRKTLVR